MTQENEELLFKDLCTRFPYRTMVKCNTDYRHEFDEVLSVIHIMNFYQFEIKPYLRPMSSMTEEEVKEYNELCGCNAPYPGIVEEAVAKFMDWLNAHHFDYRGLIEKGLALEAPKDMYTQTDN